jgi:Fur family ferric uptake transcriptional regulator
MPRGSGHGHVHLPPSGPVALRPRGRRLTKQRQLIWEALVAEPDSHLSAEDIARRVQAQLPRTNASTVYRTLELLVEEGLVARADLGGDRIHYEPAAGHPHHHVVCDECGRVVHVHDEALGSLKENVEAASGYRLGTRSITLFGTCPDCRRRQRRERPVSSRS